MDMRALQSVLEKLSEDQLREVNGMVVRQIRRLIANKQQNAARQFHVGQKVKWWSNKRHRWVTIQIDRINPKTVIGQEILPSGEPGITTWRVSPSLLQAA